MCIKKIHTNCAKIRRRASIGCIPDSGCSSKTLNLFLSWHSPHQVTMHPLQKGLAATGSLKSSRTIFSPSNLRFRRLKRCLRFRLILIMQQLLASIHSRVPSYSLFYMFSSLRFFSTNRSPIGPTSTTS